MSLTFYPMMWPLFAVTTVAGAWLGWSLWRSAGLSGVLGACVVGPAGAVGPLLTMVPLQSCTFEPERSTVDNAIGVVAFGIGAAVMIALVAWVGRALSQPGGLANLDSRDRSGTFRGSFVPWLLLLPSLAILVVFLYWPLMETFRLSTHKAKRAAPKELFVCVDNYSALISPSLEWWLIVPAVALALVVVASMVTRRADPAGLGDAANRWRRVRGILVILTVVAAAAAVFGNEYRSVFVTTMILTSATVLIGLAVGLGIAMLVSQPLKGRSIYRTLLIWPYAISPPIAGILFSIMFDPLSGIAGHVFETLTPWTMPEYGQDAWLARVLVIVSSIWKTLGFTILFYIAGLQNVSTEMLEAAQLDGANAWQRFRNFILPSLTPITFFLIVTNVTYAFFQIFGTIDALTKGGPSGATTDAMTWIVLSADKNLGAGASASLVLFAMVLAVTAWQFRATGRRVHYGA